MQEEKTGDKLLWNNEIPETLPSRQTLMNNAMMQDTRKNNDKVLYDLAIKAPTNSAYPHGNGGC